MPLDFRNAPAPEPEAIPVEFEIMAFLPSGLNPVRYREDPAEPVLHVTGRWNAEDGPPEPDDRVPHPTITDEDGNEIPDPNWTRPMRTPIRVLGEEQIAISDRATLGPILQAMTPAESVPIWDEVRDLIYAALAGRQSTKYPHLRFPEVG